MELIRNKHTVFVLLLLSIKFVRLSLEKCKHLLNGAGIGNWGSGLELSQAARSGGQLDAAGQKNGRAEKWAGTETRPFRAQPLIPSPFSPRLTFPKTSDGNGRRG